MDSNKKNYLFIILPLLVFNLVLATNILLGKNALTAPTPQCYDDTRINNYPKNITTTEQLKCVDCQRVSVGKILFQMYGESANCRLKKTEQEKQECYEEHPYGSLGTFFVGDNLVMSEGRSMVFAGEDGAGLHWLMSSTTEPIGNVVGLSSKSSDVLTGNDLLINKDAYTKAVEFSAGGHKIDSKLLLAKLDTGDQLEEINSIKLGENLEVLEKGVCDWGKESDLCHICNMGANYSMLTLGGLEVKGLLEIDGAIRVKAENVRDFEKGDCSTYYRVASPYADKISMFKNKYDFKNDEFIAFPCVGEQSYCNPEHSRQKLVKYEVPVNGSSIGEILTCNSNTPCHDCVNINLGLCGDTLEKCK